MHSFHSDQWFYSSLSWYSLRCAQAAQTKGYHVFGLQYFGECWASSRGSAPYARDGKSTQCTSAFNYGACVDESPLACVGNAHTNYVYAIEQGERTVFSVLKSKILRQGMAMHRKINIKRAEDTLFLFSSDLRSPISSIKDWNSIDIEIRTAPSVNSFKCNVLINFWPTKRLLLAFIYSLNFFYDLISTLLILLFGFKTTIVN